MGSKSWVGYHQGTQRALRLPTVKPGVLEPLAGVTRMDARMITRANTAYAKDYSAWSDVLTLLRGFRSLGAA
ncbi:MAG TPA: hypothetical protein PK760_09245 [Flavobacteriales bacterium]|nr:hypothetical protein [Flavobacteriales bacterium]